MNPHLRNMKTKKRNSLLDQLSVPVNHWHCNIHAEKTIRFSQNRTFSHVCPLNLLRVWLQNIIMLTHLNSLKETTGDQQSFFAFSMTQRKEKRFFSAWKYFRTYLVVALFISDYVVSSFFKNYHVLASICTVNVTNFHVFFNKKFEIFKLFCLNASTKF